MIDTPPPQTPALDGFRERAIREAQRYGADPWIFVRELLQNARDAGATKVQFLYKESDRQCELTCLDNGEGMAWDHAQTYLFSLYTSSKEDSKNKAGRFGVGFWSILRFAPSQIVIQSKPRGARISQGWGLSLDGQLRKAKFSAPAEQSGTCIRLSRPIQSNHDGQRLLDAVRAHGRFLMQRDAPEMSLPVLVNGVCINEPFALPEPSLSFSSRGIRGVVALAPHGKVELFSRGLRVRTAASLDDLVSSQPPKSSLPDGLNVAPQILLDCDNIQVLLHRSDVRENADLNRALSLTRRHLRRLVEAQLSGIRPPGGRELLARASMWFTERSFLFYGVSALGLTLGLSAIIWNRQPKIVPSSPTPLALGSMRANYRGPSVEYISPGAQPHLDFQYAPADLELHFRQFSISDLKKMRPEFTPKFSRYRGTSCQQAQTCVEVKIRVEGQSTKTGQRQHALNLVEATGYRIVPPSLQLTHGGKVQKLGRSLVQDQHGDPWIRTKTPLKGVLSYQMAKAVAPSDPTARAKVQDPAFIAWKPVRSLDVSQAENLVARRIRYALDEQTALAHQRSISSDDSVFTRGAQIRAGDCDVQNTFLSALLREQGYASRLAFGYVGRQGRLGPVAHAWSEYRPKASLPWSIADASILTPPKGMTLLSQGPLEPEQVSPDDSTPTIETSRNPAWFGWSWIALGLCLIASGLVWLRRQKAPAGSIDKSQKRLTDLLLSALEQPAAFSGIPGVFRRPVIARLQAGPISLHELKKAHRFGRLWSASHEQALALRAVASHDEILDTKSPVARAVADHLQTKNLDHWQRLWEARGPSVPALDLLNEAFDYLGASIHITLCSAVEGPPEQILFGARPLTADFSTRRGLEVPARCLVFYPARGPLLAKLMGPQASLACFELLRDALSRIAVDPELKSNILGYVATLSQEEAAA